MLSVIAGIARKEPLSLSREREMQEQAVKPPEFNISAPVAVIKLEDGTRIELNEEVIIVTRGKSKVQIDDHYGQMVVSTSGDVGVMPREPSKEISRD